MAAAPVISANLSTGGEAFSPPVSKKPLFLVSNSQKQRLFKTATSPVKRVKHLLFGAILHPQIRVVKPLPVDIVSQKDGFVARFKTADEFGTGATVSLALEDLAKTVAELYIQLNEQSEKLGPDLKDLQNKLGRYLALRQK